MKIKYKWGVLVLSVLVLTIASYYAFGHFNETFNFTTNWYAWGGEQHSYISIDVVEPSDVQINLFSQTEGSEIKYVLRHEDDELLEEVTLNGIERLNKTYHFEKGRYSIVISSSAKESHLRFNAFGGSGNVKFASSEYDREE